MQNGKWLGFIIDTKMMQFIIPEEKIQKVLKLLAESLKNNCVNAKEISRIAGHIISMSLAICIAGHIISMSLAICSIAYNCYERFTFKNFFLQTSGTFSWVLCFPGVFQGFQGLKIYMKTEKTKKLMAAE